ncbi:MAG: porphobilinogen synthase [Alphaproteobacteria bacterium]
MIKNIGSFPNTRLRRNRMSEWSRRLVQEHCLSTADLIWPIFVMDKEGSHQEEIASLPNVYRFSIDKMIESAKEAYDLGIAAIALFPYVESHLKTEDCSEAWNDDNLVARCLRRLKEEVPNLGVICDIALDPYNIKGHDGFVSDDGVILNDETLEALGKQALCMAKNGASALAPSDMMDGRIAYIRHLLETNGYKDLPIISYAAKYASSFYGPFRDAIGSSGNLKGDKKSYQMNPANSDEAIREALLDIREGADMFMVKPGMPYLDIIYRIKSELGVPTLAYQVSGEYAMIMAAVQNGWLDGEKAMIESLLCFKRAGADAILTYFAYDVAKYLNNNKI